MSAPPSIMSIPNLDVFSDSDLSLFQKVLLTTDGTVTQLLELHTGLSVRVHKITNELTYAPDNDLLATNATDRLLKRAIVLCNDSPEGMLPLLYAESLFVIDRMPTVMQNALLETNCPIGLLWREHRLETYREVIACYRERMGHLCTHFNLPSDAILLSRTYVIHHGQRPLGMITEKFPAITIR